MKGARGVWVLVLALGWPAVAVAAAADMKLNVDCEFGWQGCYRPHRWTPVSIDIHSGEPKAFGAVVTLSGLQDELSTMTIRHGCVLTPDTPYRAPLVTKLAFGVPECELQIRNESDGRVWQQVYRLWDWDQGRQVLQPVGVGDVLLVVAGQAKFGLRQLPKRAYNEVQGQQAYGQEGLGKIHVKQRPVRNLPWDWPAYDAVDLLILYDPDWPAVREAQKTAVVEWVSAGGRLLVILGAHPLPRNDPIARLLPLTVGDARETELPEEALRTWGCAATTRNSAPCWSLEDVRGFGWSSDDLGTDRPVFAHGPVGFGRVGVLAFDPSAVGGTQGENLAPFWLTLAGPLLDTRGLTLGQPEDRGDSSFYNYRLEPTADETNAVLNFLMDIPEMEPISIVWVVVLLVGLAVVIGPLDYLILRRRDRLPLTWLTFACYIGVFSVLAYFGVRALRAGDTQVRAVSVLDGVQERGEGWTCRYSGIFASESGDYRLEGLDRTQWWSAIVPNRGMYLNFTGRQTGLRQVQCVEQDGGCLPTYLPVNIWSMQCLVTDSREPTLPLTARVTADEQGVRATLENLLDVPIVSGYVLFGRNQVAHFGRIAAKGTQEVEAPWQPWQGWRPRQPKSDVLPMWPIFRQPREEFHPGSAFAAEGPARRTQAIRAYLESGAAVVCVEYEEAPLGFGLENRSYRTVHKGLVRVVVIPEKEPS